MIEVAQSSVELIPGVTDWLSEYEIRAFFKARFSHLLGQAVKLLPLL
jgi:hypothetical protein